MPSTRFAPLILLALLLPLAAVAQRAAERVTIDQPMDHDLYAAARELTVAAPIYGDATVAGESVRVRASVYGDLNAAGEIVEVLAPMGDDVRALGRVVRVRGDIADHLLAAGLRVAVERDVSVDGFAWLAAEEVRVAGRVGGDLRAAGERLLIEGRVGGDVHLLGDEMRIEAGAHIGGDLIWRGERAPIISPDAVIEGAVMRRPLPATARPPDAGEALAAAALFGALGLLVTGLVLLLLLPGPARRIAGAMGARKGLAPLLGFGLLVATPFAVLLLLATGVGALLGLILLALYLALLPIAWLAGAYAVTEAGLALLQRREARMALRALLFALTVGVLGVAQLLPLLGWLLGLALLCYGLGGIVLAGARGAVTARR